MQSFFLLSVGPLGRLEAASGHVAAIALDLKERLKGYHQLAHDEVGGTRRPSSRVEFIPQPMLPRVQPPADPAPNGLVTG